MTVRNYEIFGYVRKNHAFDVKTFTGRTQEILELSVYGDQSLGWVVGINGSKHFVETLFEVNIPLIEEIYFIVSNKEINEPFIKDPYFKRFREYLTDITKDMDLIAGPRLLLEFSAMLDKGVKTIGRLQSELKAAEINNRYLRAIMNLYESSGVTDLLRVDNHIMITNNIDYDRMTSLINGLEVVLKKENPSEKIITLIKTPCGVVGGGHEGERAVIIASYSICKKNGIVTNGLAAPYVSNNIYSWLCQLYLMLVQFEKRTSSLFLPPVQEFITPPAPQFDPT